MIHPFLPYSSSRLIRVFRECRWRAAHDGNARRVLSLFLPEWYGPRTAGRPLARIARLFLTSARMLCWEGVLGRETAAKAKAGAPPSLGSRWAVYQAKDPATTEDDDDDGDDDNDDAGNTLLAAPRLGLGTPLFSSLSIRCF